MSDLGIDSDLPVSKGSQIISKVLTPAIRLWLRSQTDAATALEFWINGSDRQILRGHIPSVSVSAEQVVYQGLHLSQIALTATQIQINLGQMLKGRPLRLLNIVPVAGEVQVTQADLDASVRSPLLRQAMTDVLTLLLSQSDLTQAPELANLQAQPPELHNLRLALAADQLTLTAQTPAMLNSAAQLTLQAALRLLDSSHLQLSELSLAYPTPQGVTKLPIPPLALDLGSEVSLQQLHIAPEGITCRGQVNVIPA